MRMLGERPLTDAEKRQRHVERHGPRKQSPSHADSVRRWQEKNPEKRREITRRAAQKRAARQNDYHQERMDRVRVGGCLDCGTNDGPLHFHHRDPASKHREVGRMANASDAAFDAEVALCDVVCQPCHVERHRLLRQLAGKV